MLSLRTTLITLGTAAGLLVVSPALAADISIEQAGAPNALGNWVLHGPSSRAWQGSAAFQTVSITESGSYTLNVIPPSRAPNVTLKLQAANGTTIAQTTNLSLTASLDQTQTYHFVIEYGYESLISIESVPTGAPFSLEDLHGRIVASGVTPERITVPSGTYTAKYGFLRTCAIPKPQTRSAGPRQNVEFMGRYTCGSSSVSSSSRSSVSSSSARSSQAATGHVSMWLRPHQREAVAGGTVLVTLGIRNHERRTQHDLWASFTFDAALLTVVEPVPGGGVVHGNTVTWQIPELLAQQTWTVQVPVRVRDTVTMGQRLQLSAAVDGPEVDHVVSGSLRETVAIGTTRLPATGAAMDVWAALLGLAAASVLTVGQRRVRL